jgi:hypothetical protein
MKLYVVIGCFVLLMMSCTAAAQVQKKRETPPKIKDLPICGRDVYADLTITGAEVRKSDDIIVTIQSKGTCDVNRTTQMTFWAITTKEDYVTFWKHVTVPPLKSGESTQIKLFWTSGIYGSFDAGTIKFKFTVDSKYQIKEEDEYNNTFFLKKE